MKIRSVVVLGGLILWQAAVHAATGSVRGEVSNGTKGGGSVEGLEVGLWTHATPGDKPIATAKTDKDGKFELTDVPLSDKGVYEVRVNYGDATYTSDPIVVNAKTPTATAQVTVYDPSTDASRLIVVMHHIRVLEVKDGALRVGERMIVLNVADPHTGGRTFMGERGDGGRRKVLRLSLPKGAQNVDVHEEHGAAMMGAHTEESPLELGEDHYVDMSPILPTPIEALHSASPGEVKARTVAYTYDLKPQGGTYDLSRSLDYRTFTFAVLTKDPTLKLQAPLLKEGGEMPINNQTWHIYQAERVEPGVNLEILVKDKGFAFSEQGMAWGMAILIFVACVVGVIVGTRVRRSSEPSPRRAPTPEIRNPKSRAARHASLAEERAFLIDEIARLDDRYESGEISEEQYQRERAAKKNRLVELTKKLQKTAS
jgi:5-hydroxyisourate hydrolase-like protein (transthyretin family)